MLRTMGLEWQMQVVVVLSYFAQGRLQNLDFLLVAWAREIPSIPTASNGLHCLAKGMG